MSTPRSAEVGQSGGARRAGRPRSARLDAVILEAAGDLLATEGYGATGIEAIARRAGVGKTTIYRRWRSKEELVTELLARIADEMMPVADLGDTRRELNLLVATTIRHLTRTSTGGVFQALVSEFSHNPALRDLVHRQVVGTRRAEVRAVIERGIARDDLRADTDVEIAHELLIGPIYYRFLFGGECLSRRFGERIVACFLRGAAAGTAST